MILCCQVLTEVDALKIIWGNDRYQSGFSCVIPRVSYIQKGQYLAIFKTADVNVLMLILEKDGETLAHGYVSSR